MGESVVALQFSILLEFRNIIHWFNSLNKGEKMKELALETIMMMEHAVLNNLQENVEDSFISDILTFKANEKSELSNINKDEANVSQCVIEKQKKIEDIKNNIIKLKSQL